MHSTLSPSLPRPRARDLDVMNGEFCLPRMAHITPTSIEDVAIAYGDLTDEQLVQLQLETFKFRRTVAEAIDEQNAAICDELTRRINVREVA